MHCNIFLKILIVFSMLLSNVSSDMTVNFPALRFIFNFITGGENNRNKTKSIAEMTAERILLRGQCHFNFLDHIQYRDSIQCAPEDIFMLENEPTEKPPLIVKCFEKSQAPNWHNFHLLPIEKQNLLQKMLATNQLETMRSVQQILEILKPIGNATKPSELGSCVFVLFSSKSCVPCHIFMKHTKALPLLFPTLTFAHIDVDEFPSFNTEFGIVGVPTFLLFHQGRPIIKWNDSSGSPFSTFITLHTGIKKDQLVNNRHLVGSMKSFLREHPEFPTPYDPKVLALAWIFILVVLGYFIVNTRIFKQVVEIIKRNWRESAAQME